MISHQSYGQLQVNQVGQSITEVNTPILIKHWTILSFMVQTTDIMDHSKGSPLVGRQLLTTETTV